jgi:hypothetical protein
MNPAPPSSAAAAAAAAAAAEEAEAGLPARELQPLGNSLLPALVVRTGGREGQRGAGSPAGGAAGWAPPCSGGGSGKGCCCGGAGGGCGGGGCRPARRCASPNDACCCRRGDSPPPPPTAAAMAACAARGEGASDLPPHTRSPSLNTCSAPPPGCQGVWQAMYSGGGGHSPGGQPQRQGRCPRSLRHATHPPHHQPPLNLPLPDLHPLPPPTDAPPPPSPSGCCRVPP